MEDVERDEIEGFKSQNKDSLSKFSIITLQNRLINKLQPCKNGKENV